MGDIIPDSDEGMPVSAGKPRVLYFVPERPALADGVLHAQVLARARFLQRQGIGCMFVGSETSENDAVAAEHIIRDRYGIPAGVYGVYSGRIPYFSSVVSAFHVKRLAMRTITDFGPTHVYTRGFNASPAARSIARICGAICVMDVRGVAAEETALKRGHGPVYRFLLGRELHEIRVADRLACVSQNLKEWIRRNTGRRDAIVIPSCVDLSEFGFRGEARDEIRARLGLGREDRLLCYCGDIGRWQRIDDIIGFFITIGKIRPRYRFLFLSRHERALRGMCLAAGLSPDRCFFIGCEHQQVASYLSASDAGVIMREDTVVNNVASPVKVGEYLGCGLPVILTKGIGDYSEMVVRKGVGVCLDGTPGQARRVVEFLEGQDQPMLRKRVVDFAREQVSWEAYLDDLKRLFAAPDNL
ncbi:MAG: glycosyltransferase [Kiritimatiellia bacterium]